MRIGIDACCWSNRRGFGRFTRELLNSLIAIDKTNEYIFFVDSTTAATAIFPDGVELVTVPTNVPPTQAASASGRRSLKDLWAFSRQVMKHKFSLFFFPTAYSYFPILNRTKVVVTIHDMSTNLNPHLHFPNRKLMLFSKVKQYLAVQQAHLLVTVSKYSQQQIVEYYDIPESRVQVISEGTNAAFKVLPQSEEMVQVLRRYQLEPDKRLLLYVGGISPLKNLKALVDAYHQLTRNSMFSDVKLVLVGDYKSDSFYSDYPTVKSRIEQLRLRDKVIFTGFIEDEELAYLYNAASLLVLPSLDEGFGLPAIEAMACGTPVISSNKGSLPEIIGEAGRFFDPYHVESIIHVLQEVLSNDVLRHDMKQRGLIRAKKFRWEVAARKAVDIFTEVVESR